MQGHEAVEHFRSYRALGQQVLARMDAMAVRIDADKQRVQEERAAALTALAVAYLPTLSPEALERAEQLTGFRGFSRRSPLDAMAHERKVLESTIARIAANEAYVRRTYLVGPNGELTAEMDERQSMLDAWQKDCDPFESLPGFMDLLDTHYDTPQFSLAWWEPRYWKLWAQGDAVCVALELDDFGDDVLPAYEKVRGPRDQWLQQVAEMRARIDAVHDLVREHDTALARIPRLPELYLAQCHQVLADFLQHADPALLDDWLGAAGGDRAIQGALRRVAGTKAKIDILDELRLNGLRQEAQALQLRGEKHARKQAKYGRSKHYYSQLRERDTDPKFGPKAHKLLADLDKLDAQLDRMLRYDSYGRFDLDQDPELWYVAFTRKRPSKFTPGLRSWYIRNPQAVPVFDDDLDDDGIADDDASQAVGLAAGLIDRHDSGYLS